MLLAVSVFVMGCAGPRRWLANGFKVGPNYCRPHAAVSDEWLDADDKRVLPDLVDHAAWWTVFEDQTLNDLVAEAYRQNLTLRAAGARIAEARALRAVAVGNLFPQSQTFGSSYSHNLRTGTGDRHFSVWQGSFSLAWEVDFWGRFRRTIEAADANLDAVVFDYGDAVVTLIADVASTYIDIRTLQARLELVAENLEIQRQTYRLTEERFKAGEISDVDVQQAKSSLAQTQAFVPALETSLQISQNALCLLLGIPPEDLIPRLGESKLPTVAPEIALGIPASTLLRRPDVRRAERLLATQSAIIGVAESDLYPQISLTGTLGRSANQFKDLFRGGAGFGSVGPSLSWPIFNYGRLRFAVEAEVARFRELLALYRQTVLVANTEAENAIVTFLKAQQTLEYQLEAARAAAKTSDLINLQLEEGDVDYNRVFNVQDFRRAQEEAAAEAKGDVALALIEIYRALGGGWPSPFLRQPLQAPASPANEEVRLERDPSDASPEDAEELQLPKAIRLPAPAQ